MHGLQVAERKHKPTVLEFMEPLIDQTVPGTVEEEYMVLPFGRTLFLYDQALVTITPCHFRQAELTFDPCAEDSGYCICRRR